VNTRLKIVDISQKDYVYRKAISRSTLVIDKDAFNIIEKYLDDIYEISRKLVQENLLRYLKNGITPIVTGFIAGTIDGKITTLGRGGSDYTATLLASLVDAEQVILYTDVPGIMTGDPKYVKDHRVVPELSYSEAIMSAQLGAKRLHPRTFEPVKNTNIKST